MKSKHTTLALRQKYLFAVGGLPFIAGIKTVFLRIFLLSAIGWGAYSPAQTPNNIFLNPANMSVILGNSFSVNLQGQNFSLGLDGGSIDLFFNPKILQADSVSINTALWNFSSATGTIDNINGDIIFTNFAQFGNDASIINSLFNIATFNFHSIAKGTSQLSLGINSSDPISLNGQTLAVNTGNTTVTVDNTQPPVQVPIPDFFLYILGSGLVWISAAKKRELTFFKHA